MIRIALTTLALSAVPSLADGGELLTDFKGTEQEPRWFAVNDDVMGGRSRGCFRIQEGVVAFEGSLDTNGGGFASIRADAHPQKLVGAVGIHLRTRGDGREYSVRLRQGRVSYRATFRSTEAWADVYLPFEKFVPTWRGRILDRPPVDPASVDEIGLSIADQIDGEFRLEVDWIRTFAPFAMEQLRWQARPLVVFAPDAEDDRLKRQLSGAAPGFRDREMIAIVVLQSGASFAGNRPLTTAESSELRRRFEVGMGDFGVFLVGKDGGVKRRSDEPVDLRVLYDQIDAMPMRQAEVAARE